MAALGLGLVAFIGGSVVALADGRLGLAVGLALTGLALGGLSLGAGDPGGAALIGAGGVISGGLRLRGGAAGWGLMRPGSTPRLVLCAVCLVLALFVTLSLLGGQDAARRLAVLSVAGIATGRLTGWAPRGPGLAAAAALALALALLGGTAAQAAGAAAAIVLGALPAAEPEPAR